jgi:two-component system response regulator PilR (NtrC family)
MRNLSILVVDDEKNQRETLAQILRDQNFQVVTAEDCPQAIDLLKDTPFDIVLSDFRMPGGSGLEVAKKALELCPQCVTLIMTAYADVQSVIEAMRVGVVDYLLKPLNVDSLLRKVQILQDRRDLQREVTFLRAEINRSLESNRLLGDSSAMTEVRNLITQVAQSKGSILITGESGTGKEVAARQIHQQSAQAENKFVAINCGAIPENLLESELFGHKKGSFTGAVSDKEGLFSTANGGTLFLDEIGEMPKGLQVKLLRALQEREVVPVGGTVPQKIDVRVIAATNRDLVSDVEAGIFRKDLFYRINVVELKMPALRDRLEDVPILSRNIIKKYSAELGKTIKGLSNDALRRLMSYSWPGNVRELENVIERAMILNSSSDTIEVSDLPAGFQNLDSTHVPTLNLDEALNQFSRSHIVKALEACGGDKKEAAKVLGLGLSSLYRKLEELGIATKKSE